METVTTKTNPSHFIINPKPLSQFPDDLIAPGTLRILTLLFIILGIGLRLFHYFDNRSLWTDEIYLSSSLIRMNYLELMAPALDYQQKAPIGFLWLVRTCVLLFGKNEMALRLIPLLAGIGSLLLFLPVCRCFLKPLGVVVAIGIMALAPPLVYHSVEIKQYAVELLATIILLRLYIRYHQEERLTALLTWGIAGAAMVWFSFVSVFVLAGIGIGVFLSNLFAKRWNLVYKSILPFSLWLISFALNYMFFTSKHAHAPWLVGFFKTYGGFMPLPPDSLKEMGWFVQAGYQMLYNPLGLLWNSSLIENSLLHKLMKIPIVGIVFLFVGIGSFARNNKQWLMVLSFPVLLHLLASALELYPFMDRFILFSVPMLLLFIGRGTDAINSGISFIGKWKLVLPALILAGPLTGSIIQLVNTDTFGGSRKSQQREALLYVNDQYKAGDAVYIYWNMLHAYKFYKEAYGLKFKAIEGRDVRYAAANTPDYFQKLEQDFTPLHGKRVWVVYGTRLDFNIGDDIYRQPQWYVQEVKGGKKMRTYFAARGKEIKHEEKLDTHISLFSIPRSYTGEKLRAVHM